MVQRCRTINVAVRGGVTPRRESVREWASDSARVNTMSLSIFSWPWRRDLVFCVGFESRVQFCLARTDAAIHAGWLPAEGTPAGTLAVPPCDLRVRGAGSVTVSGAAPGAGSPPRGTPAPAPAPGSAQGPGDVHRRRRVAGPIRAPQEPQQGSASPANRMRASGRLRRRERPKRLLSPERLRASPGREPRSRSG